MVLITFFEASMTLVGIGVLVLLAFTFRILRDDFLCERNMRIHHPELYQVVLSVQSRSRRKAIFAIYEFHRYAYELADLETGERDLAKLEDNLRKHISGMYVASFRFRSLKKHTYRLYTYEDYQMFFDVLKGVSMDLHHHVYPYLDDVLQYARYTMGSLTLMIAPLLDKKNQDFFKSFAFPLGEAIELTRILKYTSKDIEKGRSYFPESLMKQYRYTQADLKKQVYNDAWKQLAHAMAEVAEERFKLILKQLPTVQERFRNSLGEAIINYYALLKYIQEIEYDVFTILPVVRLEEKNKLFLQYGLTPRE